VFIAEDAWGAYTTYGLSRTLRAAGWPMGIRPYQLRHTVGMALAEAGADLADISAHLGHTRPLTTRSHYVPITRGRMKGVADLLEGRLGWAVRDRGTGRKKTRKK
jgi:integrase